MPIASIDLPSPRAAFTSEPIFRLRVDQYHELIRSGKLTPDDPVELLEGILVFKMPKNAPHATCTMLASREIGRLLPQGWHYRSKEPITLADGEPDPDGAVVRGRIEDYALAHPGPADVALVIEVAETSLIRDRGIKLRSYARAGIGAYWIINVLERQVEVFSEPAPSTAESPGYEHSVVYQSPDHIPLVLLDFSTAAPVDALLPDALLPDAASL